MVNVIMHGCNGKMGRNIAALIADDPEITLAAGVDAFDEGKNPFPVFKDIRDCDTEADVIIDFSAAPAVDNLLTYCEEKKVPCVLCTTGLSEEQLAHVKEASGKVAILRSANMSMGINVLSELCKRASAILGVNYDVEIVEQHHHNKLDAPSGTALMLADAINEQNNGEYHYVYDRSSVRQKRDPKEIGISSVRGGSIVGDHEVLFCGPDEVITLKHTAYSRNIFANGAVNAAVYLAKKEPGLYNMGDMIAAL